MDNQIEKREYDILGYKVKIKAEDMDSSISPMQVVDKIEEESLKIRENFPGLNQGQLAMLTALKLAEELLTLRAEYKENVETFQGITGNVQRFIEEVSPTTV